MTSLSTPNPHFLKGWIGRRCHFLRGKPFCSPAQTHPENTPSSYEGSEARGPCQDSPRPQTPSVPLDKQVPAPLSAPDTCGQQIETEET